MDEVAERMGLGGSEDMSPEAVQGAYMNMQKERPPLAITPEQPTIREEPMNQTRMQGTKKR